MPKPKNTDYAPFYAGYVNLCSEDDVNSALRNSLNEWSKLIGGLDSSLAHFAYADGKWSVNQLIAHCIDTERVFQYRSLRLAREANAKLSGFDENEFADAYTAHDRTIQSLSEEFETARRSTIQLYQSFESSSLNNTGKADGKTIVLNAIGFITAGHSRHHLRILKERYL